jgi:hypothetical protein
MQDIGGLHKQRIKIGTPRGGCSGADPRSGRYDGDAIIGLDFEVDGVRCADIDRTPLQPHGRCHVLE